MSYQSHADLGGQPGHGRIDPPSDEPVFHEAWEARVLALTLALGFTGSWNLDQSRAARETLPDYARRSYYQKWLGGLTRLLGERGMVLEQEIASGRALVPALPVARVLGAGQVSTVLARGTPYERPAAAPARFAAGQTVRTLPGDRPHHCRLPRYAQGRRGVVERINGCHVWPDANSRGLGEQPQWLYTVVFDGAELWGAGAQSGLAVSIDAFEPYLESA
jgi:nitrile hydratase beta subunit